MPHFLIDCSETLFSLQPESAIIEQVHAVAKSTELFHENDIKVRVNAYKKYSTGNKIEDFIHVFSHIMEGKSDEQKSNLSRKIVEGLAALFPAVPNVGANVVELEKANYFNRNML